MSNHVHILISLQADSNSGFSDIIRDMKKYTAMQTIKSIKENPQESRKDWMMRLFQTAGKYNSNNTNFQFWRQDNHPIQIKSMEQYSKTLDYIHNNPVNSGLVEDPAAYVWSSAKDYFGKKGLVSVTMI